MQTVSPTAATRAVELQARLEDGLAGRTESFRSGTAIFRDDLPHVAELNLLRIEAGVEDLEPESLMEFTDHLQGGLPQRSIRVVEDAAADRLRPAFAAAGWTVTRTALMALRRHPDRPVATSHVQEVELERLAGARESSMRRGHRDFDTATEMLATGTLPADGFQTRAFAAMVGEEASAYCVARVASDAAWLIEVDALNRSHGHGLGRAVIWAAVKALRAGGADLIVVEADDENWAKWTFHRLGFDDVAHLNRLLRLWA